ncbi:ABC transporter substrate-binding protein [Candidatus Bathyarchaeota archaeon]|nr:ABC transporter substrate-binding protein [Candidatus Bathyarchaeota archaeon]
MTNLFISQSSLPLGDPHICSDSKNRLNTLSAIYEPLCNRIGPGIYEPNLSEAWQVDSKGLIWDFTLRKDVLFHDGSNLTANDVISSLERIRDPRIGGSFGTQGVYASYIGDAKFELISKSRFRIKMKEPFADLLDLLSEMYIASEKNLDNLPDTHIGTGSYSLNDFDKERIRMDAFNKYWRTKPSYERIFWRSQSEVEMLTSQQKSEIDIAAGLSIQGSINAANKNIDVIQKFGSLCIIFMFNCFQSLCNDKRVRQALNYALDRDAIIRNIMKNKAEPLTGPLTPLHYGWNPDTLGYNYNPNLAKELLKKAGYSEGVSIKMDIPSQMPDEAIPLSKMMIEQYEEIGVKVDFIIHKDRAAYSETVRSKKISDLCCFDSSPLSTIRVFREKLHSRLRGPWWEGYTNPTVDELIDRSQSCINSENRFNLYKKAYQLISEDAPWIFLYRPLSFWIKNPKTKVEPSWDGVIRIP